MGCVYRALNKANGKGYVGKTMCPLKKRKSEHHWAAKRFPRLPFHRALAKYGFSNFSWEVLFRSDNDEELKAEEVQSIKEMDTKVPNGYNLTDGGEGMTGWRPSEETREKIRQAQLGKVVSEESKEKMRQAHLGMTYSEESKEKNRQAQLGKTLSQEHKKKIGQASTGRTLSQETREKIRLALKGKPLSEETKEKMRQAALKHWERRRVQAS